MGFLEITRKDLQLLARDRRALVVLVALPMAFIGILGLSTGRLMGWRDDNQLLHLGVVDECRTTLSEQLEERLQGMDGLNVRLMASRTEAESLLADRELTALIVIGPEFNNRSSGIKPREVFESGSSRLKFSLSDVDVTVTCRPSAAMARTVVDQLVLFATLMTVLPDSARKAEVQSRVRSLLTGEDQDAPPSGTASNDDAATDAKTDSPAGPETSSAKPANEGSPVYQTLVPSYTVMFAFFLVNVMARSFIAERELGTLKRLRMAPVTSVDLLLGKTLPFLVISLIQSSVLFLFGRLLFGMSWGEQPWLLIPIVLCTSLAATGMGLLIATLVRTDSQVSAYANFVVITLAGISGCFMPREWLPEAMQTISLATPHAWALMAYDEALSGGVPGTALIVKSCLTLTGFAVGFFVLGCLRFRTAD